MTAIDQHRIPSVPTPGYYACRLVRGGPEVACRIIEADGLWVCLIAMEPTHAEAQTNPWKCPQMERVAFSRRIDGAEYDALLGAAAAARPGEPLADPRVAVDFRRSPSLY